MADLRQRAPRRIDRDYKGAIAALPCAACLVDEARLVKPVQVAHLSVGSLAHGKRPTGGAEKASDEWTLPLCWPHHQGNKQAIGRRGGQHEQGEEAFWAGLHIDPFQLCVDLRAAFLARAPMLTVLIKACAAARKEKFA